MMDHLKQRSASPVPMHHNQKNIPIILLTCSHPLSDFIIVFLHCIYCFFCVLFLCLLSAIVQPLAITFNKRTNEMYETASVYKDVIDD